MKKYRLRKDLPDMKAGCIFTEKDGYYMPNKESRTSRVWPVYYPQVVENNPEWFEELKEGGQFTHEDLRVAFLCGKMKGTRWSPEKQQWNYVDVFDTFEEYLGSRGQNKH